MPIVGDVLAGRYRIDAPIGVGGMSSVYRARDLRLMRDVAIKVLLPNLAADPTLTRRFTREARALAATAHPNVVSVFDVEPGAPATGREPFYVMELCEGGSLADRLAARGRLAPREVVVTITAIADGLADLHRRGFVHRDVKPHNILFARGRPKLADFGLARPEERTDQTSLTATGATVGTLAYLAPELLGPGRATPASDVYALGVVAFQCLTGRLPRPAGSMAELVDSRAEPPASVSSNAPEIGAAFDAPIATALAVDPNARPAALELAARLDDALAGARPLSGGTVPAIVTPATPAGHASVDPAAVTLADVDRREARLRPRDLSPLYVGLGAFAVLLLALLAVSSLPSGRLGGAAAGPTPGASPTSAITPTQQPTASPSPTPLPPVSPVAEAFGILDRIDAAIEDLADEGGIKTSELDNIRQRAHDVRSALEDSDYEKARNRAARLDDEVDRLDDRVQGDAMERLKDSVSRLDEAIPAD